MSNALLAEVRRLPDEQRAAVLNRLDPRVIRELDDAFATTWVSMADHMALSDAVRDVLGPRENVAIWRRVMRRVFQLPMLRGFVRMSQSLFGVTPASMYQQCDRLYRHLVRHAGVLALETRGADECTFVLRTYPAHRFRFICYVEGLEGCLGGVLDALGRPGEVEVVSVDEDRGTARYRARWLADERAGAARE